MKKSVCDALHEWVTSLPRRRFPFDKKLIPEDGIYILFEKGEEGHGGERIVRVGTHTGPKQLRSRLEQHFLKENKDRSIFRKNIGRALLAKANDPFLASWERDLTSAVMRKTYGDAEYVSRKTRVEKRVSKWIRERFSFVAFGVADVRERLALESKLISTVSWCKTCGPSALWLGNFSPKEQIRESGLWLVNELYNEPLSTKDIVRLLECGRG